jgi:hypothetical protein
MIDCYNTGVFTGKIIRMISDIRAKHGKDSVNLKNCGKFTLAEDLSDISDMTSIDLSSIYSLEGRCCSEELSFPRLQTSALFLEEFSFLRTLRELPRVARRTCRKFLEISLLHSISFNHSHLPCLLVNPIPIRRYPGAREVQAFIERLHGQNQCPRYGGMFFCFWRTSALFWKKFLF